ncbi:MAG: hypothetical protein LAT58_01165 [Opitutales bacterium]|nr:hypothetical protein [Opitutales bacterium]
MTKKKTSRKKDASIARSSAAESEFEKYRIVQDRLFTSDFDKFLEEHAAGYGERTTEERSHAKTRRREEGKGDLKELEEMVRKGGRK